MLSNEATTEFLAHHGVKGMKWGVRKEEAGGSLRPRSGKALDLHPNSDGSIDIPKGVTIQRVVDSKASDLGHEVAYAAFTKGDRLRYESNFGKPKSLFVKEASQVVSLTTKVPLKAPTPERTAVEYFNSIKEDPARLKLVRSQMKATVLYTTKDFDKALANPTSKDSYALFGSLYDTANYDKKLAGVNSNFHTRLTKSGFNMILDPSDSTFGGLYDAPVAVLNPSQNLAVTSRVVVTKESSKKADAVLKDYEKINKGKKLMQRLGYDT